MRNRSLLNPTQVPTRIPVALDPAHPLGGVQGLSIPGSQYSFRDFSANRNDGVPSGSPPITQGYFGPGVSLNGTNQGVAFPSSLSTGFTVGFLVSGGTAPGTSRIDKIVAGNSDEFGFSWSHTNASYKQAFYMFSAGAYPKVQISTTLSANTWYYVAATWDGATLSVYLNGQIQGTTSASMAPVSTLSLAIDSKDGTYWQGQCAQFAWYPRALSADQISALSAEPFAMLRPIVRRLYSTPPVAGGVLTGTAAAASSATGPLVGTGLLSGTGAGATVALGAMTGTGILSGAALAASIALGALTGTGLLSGTSSALTAASGAVATTGAPSLAGAAVATSVATGALTGGGILKGTASAASSAGGALLTAPSTLAGISATTTTASGAVTGPTPVIIGNAAPQTVSLTAQTNAIYTAAAADVYRALIHKVPGSGPVLGVVAMAFAGVDHLYVFRANSGATAALLYKASTTGWVLVPYYNLVSFTAGGAAIPLDGDTLTKGGVTATIKRVMWQSGAWSGTAVGQFVVTDPAGGNFTAGAATTTSGATITLSGAQTPIAMAAGGRFEFEKSNFSGQLITRRIYGCDGVNPCFEFDGETLAPIKTGLSPDRPAHIRAHRNILFVSQEASLIYSAAGNPFKWSAVDGGGEIATGDTVTGLITLPGSQTTATLAVFLRTNTSFLYGTDPTTFNFVTFNTGIGAVPFSIQNFFDSFFLDDLGVVTLKTTLNYGNFLPSTLTKNILPFIARERGNLTASSISRAKSQFRLFFSDGYALYCTVLNQNYLGSGTVLYPDVISCTDTTKLTTDDEASYAGSANGYVYQLDMGTSFDGAAIPAYFVTAWDPVKSPRVLKRFRAASIEVQGDSYAEIQYGYQLGYASDQIPQLPSALLTLNLGGVPHWDSFVWDAFVWDGSGLTPTDIDETGTAENVRVTVTSGTNYIASYTVNSVIHQFSMRRGMRV